LAALAVQALVVMVAMELQTAQLLVQLTQAVAVVEALINQSVDRLLAAEMAVQAV
jgi:hypothetical protein